MQGKHGSTGNAAGEARANPRATQRYPLPLRKRTHRSRSGPHAVRCSPHRLRERRQTPPVRRPEQQKGDEEQRTKKKQQQIHVSRGVGTENMASRASQPWKETNAACASILHGVARSRQASTRAPPATGGCGWPNATNTMLSMDTTEGGRGVII